MAKEAEICCRKCQVAVAGKERWCEHCKLFQYEIYNPLMQPTAPPVALDTIIGNLQRSRRMYRGERSSLLLEQYDAPDGTRAWRACLMVNGRAVQHSRQPQCSPQDALRELELLCAGMAPEDV